eukprot:6883649-Prymnesium_polylepis.1
MVGGGIVGGGCEKSGSGRLRRCSLATRAARAAQVRHARPSRAQGGDEEAARARSEAGGVGGAARQDCGGAAQGTGGAAAARGQEGAPCRGDYAGGGGGGGAPDEAAADCSARRGAGGAEHLGRGLAQKVGQRRRRQDLQGRVPRP